MSPLRDEEFGWRDVNDLNDVKRIRLRSDEVTDNGSHIVTYVKSEEPFLVLKRKKRGGRGYCTWTDFSVQFVLRVDYNLLSAPNDLRHLSFSLTIPMI